MNNEYINNLVFKKVKRKVKEVDLAPVTFVESQKFIGSKVSISEHDVKYLLDDNNINSTDIAGYIGSDGDSFWFIHIEFAKENYEI